ncbi:MAG: B12-binding domain-containing radical SAM protein [Syntrophales bacterium]
MKILLVYPTALDQAGAPVKYKKAYLPPLSLAIIDSLTPERHVVRIINDCVEQIDFDADVDLIGITALTAQAPRAYQIADAFRNRGKKVVLGGIHPSLMAAEAQGHADAVVIGEIEELWEEILADAENNRLKSIYQNEELPDLDRLIVPKWDNIDLTMYRQSLGPRHMPRMPIYTTRGCVHNCKFCSVSKFFGRHYRHKPIENVLKEIDAIRADSYFFVDDNIICNPDFSAELFKALAKKNIRWMSQATTTILQNPHLIDMAAKAGCKSLFFGIESLNAENLKSVKKGFNNPEAYVELLERVDRAGIRPWLSMIVGLDHDTHHELRRTIDFLKDINIGSVVLWVLTPLPGTDLYEEMKLNGRILDTDWSKYDASRVVYLPLHFTPQELNDEFWKIYLELYSWSSVFKHTVRFFRSPRKPLSQLLIDLKLQYYTRAQLIDHTHPMAMGVHRI